MLLDLRCKAALGPNKVEAGKKEKPEEGGEKNAEEEMGHMISRDKACLKATRKPLKYLTGEPARRGESKLAWFFKKCDRHALQSAVNLEETLGNLAAISG